MRAQGVIRDRHDPGPSGETDVLSLGPGILIGDVTLSRSIFEEYGLLIGIGFGGDRIVIDDQFGAGGTGLEEIHFDDTTVLAESFIRTQLTTSTSGNDAIEGVFIDDALAAGRERHHHRHRRYHRHNI